MADNVAYWRSQGYRRHSIKVGTNDVDKDIARVRLMTEIRQPDETIDFDANGGWAPWEAIRVMNGTKDTDAWFEQPCLTYDECRLVRSQTEQVLSLDECITGVQDVVRAINDRACDVINIKLARVGGITNARAIRDVCLAYGIPMMIMCMAGTVINDTAVAHFVSALPADRCVGTWSCQDMVTADSPPGRGARNENGLLTVPTTPGLGVAPDLDIIGSPVAVFN
jgi:L-alanine-DL-glutamate epimerase-like enolase superfamily enzyme